MINLKSYNRISLIYIDAEKQEISEKYIQALIYNSSDRPLLTRQYQLCACTKDPVTYIELPEEGCNNNDGVFSDVTRLQRTLGVKPFKGVFVTNSRAVLQKLIIAECEY